MKRSCETRMHDAKMATTSKALRALGRSRKSEAGYFIEAFVRRPAEGSTSPRALASTKLSEGLPNGRHPTLAGRWEVTKKKDVGRSEVANGRDRNAARR